MYHARIARQVRATLAPLAANGRPMRTAKSRFAVAHGRPRAHSLAQRQHPSRLLPARLEPSGFAAERRPHTCRIPTAIQWQTRRVKDRQPDDPGPCRRCASALSSAADAPTHISLGSHAKSGPTMRRSPRRAVPCGHRHGASLSATDATNPAAWRRGSTHPDHRMRGWIRLLTAGDHRNANGWGPLRRGTRANARIGSSGSNRTLHTRCAAAVGIFVHSLLQGVPGSHAKHGLRIGGPSGFGFSDQQT